MLVASFMLAGIASTTSWFTTRVNIAQNVSADSKAAYFESGDGSEENPYSILYPYHLYNFAWLQYMGRFTTACYFKLSDKLANSDSKTLDMTDWILPPIGTTDNPFIGYFDGQGVKISNLTISNDYSDFKKKPAKITSLENCNIIGFFGVIGNLNDNNAYASSTVDAVSNLELNNVKVKTNVDNTLIGIVAGYVNGPIEHVGVSGSETTFDIKNNATAYSSDSVSNSNISNYSLVGYATSEYMSSTNRIDVESNAPEVVMTTETGSGDEWGGSIGMNEMFTKISDNTSSSSLKKTLTDSQGNTSASYYLSSYNDSYKYLTGGRMNVYVFNVGSNYMSVSRTSSGWNYNYSISNVTSLSSAYNFAYDKSSQTLSTTYSSTTLYLNNNSGSLEISTSSNSTKWTIDETNSVVYSTINSKKYYLYYSDSAWTLISEQDEIEYYIFESTYNGQTVYLNYDSTGATDSNLTELGTEYSTATRWIDSGSYYYASTSTTAILACNTSYKRLFIGTYNSNGDSYYRLNSSNQLVANNSYYAYWHGASSSENWSCWDGTTNSSSAATFTVREESIKNTFDINSVRLNISSGLETYYPLAFDDTNTDDVSSKNTGYVVSGSNSTSSSDIRVSRYGFYYNYSTSSRGYNLANAGISTSSFSSSSDSSLYVRTANATTSGSTVIIKDNHYTGANGSKTVEELGLKKYNDSRNALYNPNSTNNSKGIFDGASYIYGLHFMDASISVDNLITVPYALINGTTYTNYQLPRDSIDFNLKKSGYINFFAGTYYPDNSTFFSLHEIFRDENDKITTIKEIKKIYKNTDTSTNRSTPYVYLYDDGSYSSTNHGSDALFDLEWITNPSDFINYALYYYEIPVNKGEFALGSVSGKDGAYLIYLDIGASKNSINKVTKNENVTTTTSTYQYPTGVDFITDSKLFDIVGGASAVITISAPGDVGTVTFAYTNKTLSCTTKDTSYSNLKTSYKNEYVSVKCNNVELNAVALSAVEVKESRESILTYDNSKDQDNLNTKITTTTTTTNYSNGIKGDSTTETSNNGDDGVNSTISEEEYTTIVETDRNNETDILIKFHYWAKEKDSITISYEFEPGKEGNTDYNGEKTLNGTYIFTITNTSDEDIIVYIDSVVFEYSFTGDEESKVDAGIECFAYTINGSEITSSNTNIIVSKTTN